MSKILRKVATEPLVFFGELDGVHGLDKVLFSSCASPDRPLLMWNMR